MAGPFYFALVDKTDTAFDAAFARNDETMRAFRVSQREGEFAALSVLIEKPSQSLLDPDRETWCWLSEQRGSDLVPLFFGRVVGVPADLQERFVTLEYHAKPADFEAQKRSVAAGLKVAPFWDYAFIDPQFWRDADAALEARTEAWHIDPVTHEVSASSLIEGEDGIVTIAASSIPQGSLSLKYGEAPLRKVQLEMRAMWTQSVSGSLDITSPILAAFAAAGSDPGFVTSYTGSALYNTWPKKGDTIGSVYTFGPQVIRVADGRALRKKYKTVKVQYENAPDLEELGGIFSSIVGYGSVGGTTSRNLLADYIDFDFRRWGFTISCTVNFEFEIDRTEDISFNVIADVQNIVNDADDQQSEIITLSSGNIGIEVGLGSAAELPIGAVSAASFFPRPRGLEAIEFGLAHARALLMRRARCVEISIRDLPYDAASDASCRKSATVTHPDLPGGSATGKIIAYDFGVDGNTGKRSGSITIACMAGKNTAITADTGTPTWADLDYVGPDVQEMAGDTRIAVEGEIEYALPHGGEIYDPSPAIEHLIVTNGEAAQEAVLGARFLDVPEACDALNEAATTIDLQMVAIDTSPRVRRFDDSNVFLVIPQGIDLGAA
jgi:hypothetical protein